MIFQKRLLYHMREPIPATRNLFPCGTVIPSYHSRVCDVDSGQDHVYFHVNFVGRWMPRLFLSLSLLMSKKVLILSLSPLNFKLSKRCAMTFEFGASGRERERGLVDFLLWPPTG